jgi:hypothetical protein
VEGFTSHNWPAAAKRIVIITNIVWREIITMMIRTKIAITGLTPDMTSKAFSTINKPLLYATLMLKYRQTITGTEANIIPDYTVRHNQNKYRI